MPTRYDKEFKQNIIKLYKQGESAYIQIDLQTYTFTLSIIILYF